MKKEEFIDLLEDIDDEYIIKAQSETGNKKVFTMKKWFALVAAIIIIGAFATVVAAKPECRIFFEETELEGEKAGGPQGLECALSLGRGAALECHWHSIHSRTRSSPFIVHHNEKGCRIGILFHWYPLRDSNPGHPD